MVSPLVQKLAGVRDLRKILETTVKDLGQMFRAETCQVMLSNPLDPNVTSICEFRASSEEPQEVLPLTSMPLVLHGRTLGSLSVARYGDMHPEELNMMRVILGELGEIIRGAQINDIVQRDTFRDTFLVEIGNVMAYSLGVGDALFMVVNILGRALQASRCLFICTDDTKMGWKCYEYWQQDKLQSCQDYRWPTTDSPLIAQTLLSQVPMVVYEGQVNSYVSPVQEELQFISVKSLLGVALRSTEGTHGCVILQQCDYRRAWTRGEIDMVQNVADKVAEQLVKLPEEKRAREPIMQLHQRIVSHPDQDGRAPNAVSVRNALKGALGAQAIPSARATSAPAPKPPPPPQVKVAPPQPIAPAAPSSLASADSTCGGTGQSANFSPPGTANPAGAPTISPVVSKAGSQSFAPPGSGKSLGTILGAARAEGAAPAASAPAASAAAARAAHPTGTESDPYADLDFGDFTEIKEEQKQKAQPRPRTTNDPDSTLSNLDAMPQGVPELSDPGTATGSQSQFETLPPGSIGEQRRAAQENVVAAAAAAADIAMAAPQAKAGFWGDLDSIPTPKATPVAAPSAWGDLDAIPAPAGASKGGGLSTMMGKARASSSSSLFGKARGAATPPVEAAPVSDQPPPVEISEADAEVKLKAALDKKTADATSDYVFATPGLDPRMAGRVSSWIQEIEDKDRYVGGHARQVAELSVAIAREAGLNAKDVDTVRLAALLHDVGKRACPPQILQKSDDTLTDPELIVMMKHPLDGAELLESFPDLKHVAEIVRSHHEEFDGNGYPQGLKGDEIPVAARIITVANSYHSLTSKMTYGDGMPAEQAQQELVKGAGKQWDPNFVQALIQAIMSRKIPAVL